jgi:5-methyltetrahydrofolate--homocysteine methyltransferase
MRCRSVPESVGMADILEDITRSVVDIDFKASKRLVRKALKEGVPPIDIVLKGLSRGMERVGELYEASEYFEAELIASGQVMQEAMEIVNPHLEVEEVEAPGTFIIGTVRGDLHDIGKNMVIAMIRSAGFEIVDLGVDVGKEPFIEAIRRADGKVVVAMSALLTTTMPAMKEIVEEIERQGLRDRVKILLGGRPVNEQFAFEMGADGYARDAVSAVRVAKNLVGA